MCLQPWLVLSKICLEDSRTARGDLQVKVVLETSTDPEPKDWRFSFVDFVLCGILPDDSKGGNCNKKKLFDSMTMWSHEYCITNHLIESFSAAFHTKRHRKHSGKLMMLCAELTNPDLSLEIDFEGSTITGQRWFLTLSPMLRCLAS